MRVRAARAFAMTCDSALKTSSSLALSGAHVGLAKPQLDHHAHDRLKWRLSRQPGIACKRLQ